MTEDKTINIGVIGLGFMGQTHIDAYDTAARAGYPCRLMAVCDADPQRRATFKHAALANQSHGPTSLPMAPQPAGVEKPGEHHQETAGKCCGEADKRGNIDTRANHVTIDRSAATVYEHPDQLLADECVDLVSICTHTDTHVDLAIGALKAGKHVLVEKPVAIRSCDVQRLAQAAAEAKTHCMPAMCMRFWPGWVWLKKWVDEQTYGPVRSAVFQRLGCRPDWASDFYSDTARSGGALFDLHIHDADFVRWCFGQPDSVVATGSVDHVTAFYRYADGPSHVVAEGGWDHAPGFEFTMRYVVAFEKATARFDSTLDPPLTLAHDGNLEPIKVHALSGYTRQVRHLLDVIGGKRDKLAVTIDDAIKVTQMLEAERRSIESHIESASHQRTSSE